MPLFFGKVNLPSGPWALQNYIPVILGSHDKFFRDAGLDFEAWLLVSKFLALLDLVWLASEILLCFSVFLDLWILNVCC